MASVVPTRRKRWVQLLYLCLQAAPADSNALSL